MDINFWHISTYHGQSDYEMINPERDKKSGYSGQRVCYRWAGDDYLKKHFNGTPEDYEKEIIGAIYYVHTYVGDIIAQAEVEAFRNYLQKEWNNYLVHAAKRLRQYPEYEDIYGKCGPASPLLLGGIYWDKGWHSID